MRTTVDLPDALLALAKSAAAKRGTTLSAVVAEALGAHLARKRAESAPPFELVVRGRAGARMPTAEEIEATLDDEDAAALRTPRGSRRAAP